MMDKHLNSDAIEALAHGRVDLVDDRTRAHASTCEECTTHIQATWMSSQNFSAAMHEAPPLAFEVGELANAALSATARALPLRTVVLGTAAALGLVALVVGRRIALGGADRLRDVGENTWASAAAIDSVVQSQVPFGWSLVALVASLTALVAVAALWKGLSFVNRYASVSTLAIALLLASAANSASALDFTGEWPTDGESVRLDVNNVTSSEALRVAAERASLDLIDRAPSEDRVTIHVRQASARVVFESVLAGRDVTVNRTGRLVTITATPTQASPAQASPTLATPDPVAATPSPTKIPDPPAMAPSAPAPEVGERAAFGSSINVAATETVKSAIVFGGSVDVYGHVLDDAVAFGGNVTLHCGSVVGGDTVAFGGRVTRESPCTNAPPPVASVTRSHPDRHEASSSDSDSSSDHDESWIEDFFSDIASLALVFIVGLVLMRWAPERFQSAKANLQGHPIRSFGLGILAVFAVSLLALALTITIIGIPVALFVILVAMFAGYAGAGLIAILVGRALPIAALREKPVLEFAVGLAVVLIVLQLPGLGAALFSCACLAAFGAIAATRFGTRYFA